MHELINLLNKITEDYNEMKEKIYFCYARYRESNEWSYGVLYNTKDIALTKAKELMKNYPGSYGICEIDYRRLGYTAKTLDVEDFLKFCMNVIEKIQPISFFFLYCNLENMIERKSIEV
jgi:hypothetical protein